MRYERNPISYLGNSTSTLFIVESEGFIRQTDAPQFCQQRCEGVTSCLVNWSRLPTAADRQLLLRVGLRMGVWFTVQSPQLQGDPTC